LVDGLRFRDVASLQGDSASFLSTFNVINFDRVEVLRGSGSSLYGTNAVGGTVNVVTDAGGGKLHGGLQMEGGTLGLLRTRATAGGGVKDNRLTYSGGLLHLNVMSGIDGDDRMRSSGAQSFVRYAVTGTTFLSGRLFFSDDFAQLNLSPTTSGLPNANIPASTIIPGLPLAPDQVVRSALGQSITPGNATFIPGRNDPDNRRASRFWSGALIQSHRPERSRGAGVPAAGLELQPISRRHRHTGYEGAVAPALVVFACGRLRVRTGRLSESG